MAVNICHSLASLTLKDSVYLIIVVFIWCIIFCHICFVIYFPFSCCFSLYFNVGCWDLIKKVRFKDVFQNKTSKIKDSWLSGQIYWSLKPISVSTSMQNGGQEKKNQYTEHNIMRMWWHLGFSIVCCPWQKVTERHPRSHNLLLFIFYFCLILSPFRKEQA